LYREYTVRNELNKLKINGEEITSEIKELIYKNLFENRPVVRHSDIIKLLSNTYKNEINLSGADTEEKGGKGEFTTSLASYVRMKGVFGEEFIRNNYKLCERIIYLHTIFTTQKNLVVKRLKYEYPSLTDGELQKIKGLNFTGWGSLSEKLLNGMEIIVDGEEITLIEAMRRTNLNLMQLASSAENKYSFKEAIEKANADFIKTNKDYDLVNDIYCPPAVKRGVRQALTIIDEIIYATGKKPERIFVETTRTEGEKKRTTTRKKSLLIAINQIKQDYGYDLPKLISELNCKEEKAFNEKRLYLYFAQLGRCAYSGEPIDLSQLATDMYDIDHIYPQSKVKDDSLRRNKVLVLKSINQNIKKDFYPLPPQIRNNPKVKALWTHLKASGLMDAEKYARLTRASDFEDGELEGFIARQLVITNQSVKAVAELLKIKYPDTEIVYAKAGNVSDFRKEFGLLKCREINDLHHAQDAYLNIVVGNVFRTKFTNDPRSWFRKIRILCGLKNSATPNGFTAAIFPARGKRNISNSLKRPSTAPI
jgi:CRISPR-associated protein Cas9/Csn1, subtype II/NMEMI